MKKTISLLIAMFMCVISHAQFKDDGLPISYVSLKKDTLFLLNDKVGWSIADVWYGNCYEPKRDGKRPHIKFVTQNYILDRYITISSGKRQNINNKQSIVVDAEVK